MAKVTLGMVVVFPVAIIQSLSIVTYIWYGSWKKELLADHFHRNIVSPYHNNSDNNGFHKGKESFQILKRGFAFGGAVMWFIIASKISKLHFEISYIRGISFCVNFIFVDFLLHVGVLYCSKRVKRRLC